MANSTAEPAPEKPRRRWPARSLRVGMWFFAIVTVLSVTAWGVSVRWTVFYMGHPFLDRFGVDAGYVLYVRVPLDAFAVDQLPDAPWTWHWLRRETPMGWSWPTYHRSLSGGYSDVSCPLWLTALGGVAGAVLCRRQALRLDRRGCCLHCGYPRTGLPAAAVCPECGRDA
ncbi:MAG: hypothetical protein KF745_12330 [Phycisphaeraceae bacterium]|nr:hypothetical protein [Phycisphaeraceae bacterium]